MYVHVHAYQCIMCMSVGLCICESCSEAPRSHGALGLHPQQTTLLQAGGEVHQFGQI